MEEAKRERNNSLDIIKGFAIINIILIHTVWWSGVAYIPHDIIRQLTLLVDVPLFFFLSGWAASLHKQTLVTTIKRLLKMYIPYVIMVMVLFLALLLFYDRIVPWDVVKQWLTFTFHDSYEFSVVMGSMWFLAPFMIISIATLLLTRILKNKKLSILFIIILIGVNIFFSCANPAIANIVVLGITSFRIVIFYLLFYFVGMYSRDFRLTSKQFLFAFITIFVIFLMYLWSQDFQFQLQVNKFPPTMFYLLSSTFALLLALLLKSFEHQLSKSIENNKLLKFLSFSGVNVYNLYLYQGFGGSIIFYMIYSPQLRMLPWFLLLPLCFLCNMFISYTLAYIFGRLNKTILNIKILKEKKNEL